MDNMKDQMNEDTLNISKINDNIDKALEIKDYELYKNSFLKLALYGFLNDVAVIELLQSVYATKYGFEKAIDYREFLYKDYTDPGQILAVRKGLEDRVNTLLYNDPKRYNSGQMWHIYEALRDGLKIEKYNIPERYTDKQMKFIFMGIRHGIDVSQYDVPEVYDGHEMRMKYRDLMDKKRKKDYEREKYINKNFQPHIL